MSNDRASKKVVVTKEVHSERDQPSEEWKERLRQSAERLKASEPEPNSLEALEAARRELESLERSWENYNGNNPNKYRAQIKSAQAKVRTIEWNLRHAAPSNPGRVY